MEHMHHLVHGDDVSDCRKRTQEHDRVKKYIPSLKMHLGIGVSRHGINQHCKQSLASRNNNGIDKPEINGKLLVIGR